MKNRSAGLVKVILLRRIRGRPGPNGGRLPYSLRLRIDRIRGGMQPPRRIYRGKLRNGARRFELGRWRAGEARRFRFQVHFHERGQPRSTTTGDNHYAGSRARIRFIWRARRR